MSQIQNHGPEFDITHRFSAVLLEIEPLADFFAMKPSALAVTCIIFLLLAVQATSAAMMLDAAVPGQQVIVGNRVEGEEREEVIVIIGDHWLRAYCIIGAVMGSILSIALFPPKEENQKIAVRRIALNSLTSLICGIMCTPVLVRYFNFPKDGDWLLFASGAVSFSSVSVLQAVVPMIPLYAKGKLKEFAGKMLLDSPPDRPSQEP